jgi:hypothetical protein
MKNRGKKIKITRQNKRNPVEKDVLMNEKKDILFSAVELKTFEKQQPIVQIKRNNNNTFDTFCTKIGSRSL